MWAYTSNGVHSLSGRGARYASIPPAIRRAVARANPLHWLGTWFQHQATREELYGLDDRTLADLNITRGDFPRILNGTFRRDD
ncbi:MAG TPA: DUF1127 domain-containing protein [Acetobacteraceae bacterium]|jgi:uncharacterized protein YjiS (DUF1127 family)|nr:DUF1127 domain-containing protein [Acetobacteraceae bacterium]